MQLGVHFNVLKVSSQLLPSWCFLNILATANINLITVFHTHTHIKDNSTSHNSYSDAMFLHTESRAQEIMLMLHLLKSDLGLPSEEKDRNVKVNMF